jgi:WD40 repeat protein
LYFHKESVFCLCVLNDKRILSSSNDCSIRIFNQISFECDLIINENNEGVIYVFQLNDNSILSCSYNNEIKIYKLIGKYDYQIIQKLNKHKNFVFKVIQLKNENLISVSQDETIKFWKKYEEKYIHIDSIHDKIFFQDIIEINNNEIAVSSSKLELIIFYEIEKKKEIFRINSIKCYFWNNILKKLNNKILLVGGYDEFYIIDYLEHKLKIKINNNNCDVTSILILNENDFLIGDFFGNIKKFQYKNNQCELIYDKQNAHFNEIYSMINFNNKFLFTCSEDYYIKIWKIN